MADRRTPGLADPRMSRKSSTPFTQRVVSNGSTYKQVQPVPVDVNEPPQPRSAFSETLASGNPPVRTQRASSTVRGTSRQRTPVGSNGTINASLSRGNGLSTPGYVTNEAKIPPLQQRPGAPVNIPHRPGYSMAPTSNSTGASSRTRQRSTPLSPAIASSYSYGGSIDALFNSSPPAPISNASVSRPTRGRTLQTDHSSVAGTAVPLGRPTRGKTAQPDALGPRRPPLLATPAGAVPVSRGIRGKTPQSGPSSAPAPVVPMSHESRGKTPQTSTSRAPQRQPSTAPGPSTRAKTPQSTASRKQSKTILLNDYPNMPGPSRQNSRGSLMTKTKAAAVECNRHTRSPAPIGESSPAPHDEGGPHAMPQRLRVQHSPSPGNRYVNGFDPSVGIRVLEDPQPAPTNSYEPLRRPRQPSVADNNFTMDPQRRIQRKRSKSPVQSNGTDAPTRSLSKSPAPGGSGTNGTRTRERSTARGRSIAREPSVIYEDPDQLYSNNGRPIRRCRSKSVALEDPPSPVPPKPSRAKRAPSTARAPSQAREASTSGRGRKKAAPATPKAPPPKKARREASVIELSISEDSDDNSKSKNKPKKAKKNIVSSEESEDDEPAPKKTSKTKKEPKKTPKRGKKAMESESSDEESEDEDCPSSSKKKPVKKTPKKKKDESYSEESDDSAPKKKKSKRGKPSSLSELSDESDVNKDAMPEEIKRKSMKLKEKFRHLDKFVDKDFTDSENLPEVLKYIKNGLKKAQNYFDELESDYESSSDDESEEEEQSD